MVSVVASLGRFVTFFRCALCSSLWCCRRRVGTLDPGREERGFLLPCDNSARGCGESGLLCCQRAPTRLRRLLLGICPFFVGDHGPCLPFSASSSPALSAQPRWYVCSGEVSLILPMLALWAVTSIAQGSASGVRRCGVLEPGREGRVPSSASEMDGTTPPPTCVQMMVFFKQPTGPSVLFCLTLVASRGGHRSPQAVLSFSLFFFA